MMLKFKNAQELNRAEMKNLTGGNWTSGKIRCMQECLVDAETNQGFCFDGRPCNIYYCGPDPEKDFGYKCY
jgi:hypothetical protein